MGRPSWYKEYRPPRRRLPGRQALLWVGVALLAMLLAAAATGFRPHLVFWPLGFVSNFCRFLALAIFLRALLSWLGPGRYSQAVAVLDDLTRPILSPLRRVIPTFGGIDFTPLIAMIALYFIPSILARIVALLT